MRVIVDVTDILVNRMTIFQRLCWMIKGGLLFIGKGLLFIFLLFAALLLIF